ncbi:prion-inhibition and propagation-domain-containing protein [Hypoxylon sp. FL0543]|nr:prion-inhibition and propagation-domain-containing protein [Hypoxylon sp. FL0543]
MDPGAALGAISLAFQVFSGCIKGCQLLIEARDLPQKYGYLRHRLRLEQLKLLDWWNASGLTAEAAFRETRLDEGRQAVIDSLFQIRYLTLDIDRIKQRYDLALKIVDKNDAGDTAAPAGLLALEVAEASRTRETLRQKSLQYADTFMKCPARLRWAVFDGTKFEQLIARFAELNNSMHFSLELEQRRRHFQLQEATQMQVLQVHDKLDQVFELIQSLRLPPLHSSQKASPESSSREPFDNLERLARFKALSMTVGHGDSYEVDAGHRIGLEVPSPRSLELPIAHLELGRNQRQQDVQRVAGTYKETPVWVEWKYYDERRTTLVHECIEDRIARLATLLRKNPEKPEELRLPAAVGYVHDPTSTRFGLVFESPGYQSTSAPKSLYSRLQRTRKPSLTVRLNMARRLVASLEYLHVMKWLHKGLRSDNILFLTSSGSDWLPLDFCLSGFDYSRPADPDEVTELPSHHREHDLYRHPDVQFDVPRDGEYGYREKHDIYSLGVVLMEIGLWQPIHQFLGLSLDQLIPRPAIRGVHSALLKAESVAIIEAEAGERHSEAVRLCLGHDPGYPWDESEISLVEETRTPPDLRPADNLRRAKEILRSIIV